MLLFTPEHWSTLAVSFSQMMTGGSAVNTQTHHGLRVQFISYHMLGYPVFKQEFGGGRFSFNKATVPTLIDVRCQTVNATQSCKGHFVSDIPLRCLVHKATYLMLPRLNLTDFKSVVKCTEISHSNVCDDYAVGTVDLTSTCEKGATRGACKNQSVELQLGQHLKMIA